LTFDVFDAQLDQEYGWDVLDKMERDVLVEKFSLDRVNPKSAMFDEKKLEWLNGQYFLRRSPEFFLPLVKPLWEKAGVDLNAFPDAYLLRVLGLLKDRSKRLGDFVEYGLYFFWDPDSYEEKARQKHFGPGAADLLESLGAEVRGLPEFSAASLEAVYKAFAEGAGRKGGELIHPTRLAISGMPFGPGLYELMEALGREIILRRMDNAVAAIRVGF
jgi:glutamyl-tRNA synthetase